MKRIVRGQALPQAAGFEALVARDELARADGRKVPRSEARTPPLRTLCGGCSLSLSAFPSRRAFAAHRQLCEQQLEAAS